VQVINLFQRTGFTPKPPVDRGLVTSYICIPGEER
jgi:hypothetical protein